MPAAAEPPTGLECRSSGEGSSSDEEPLAEEVEGEGGRGRG